jgi:hypothetical protein
MKKIVRYKQYLAGPALMLLAAFTAADERVLVLQDGSQIRGELISYEQGTYTVQTESLGTIKLSDRQVEQVLSSKELAPKVTTSAVDNTLAGTPPSTGGSASIEALQSAIMSSPSLMSSIMALQSDPQVQALLADPEVLRAVQSLDFDALSRNSKIQALMQNPQVKALQSSIGTGQ